MPHASATDYTFNAGASGDWYAPGVNTNWTPSPTNGLTSGTLNTAGNTTTILGAVNYNAGAAGGDFLLGAGDTMTVDGGSWTQALGTNNWVKVGASGGAAVSTLDIKNGGAFNIQSSGQQFRVGLDGGVGSVVVESTAGGLNTAVNGNTNSLQVGSGSSVSLLGGTNSLGEINSVGTVTFGGGTTTTGQWDNAAATYKVTGGMTTGTNYDMNTAGASLTVSGGSVNFTGNFTNLRNVGISGGALSVAGTLVTNASTNVNMTGGSLTKSGNGNVNLNASGSFILSGNASFSMTGTGEFQPGYTIGSGALQSISGNATINITGLTAFQGGTSTRFDINGGALTLGSAAYDGIYSSGGYFNFTTGSNGSILFSNAASGQTNIFEGQIRYNDTIYTSADFASVFTVTHPTANSTLISLMDTTAVPEPATVFAGVLMIGALGWNQRRRLRDLLR